MLLYILLSIIVIGFTITYFVNRNMQQVNKFFQQEFKHLDKTYHQFVNTKIDLLPQENFTLHVDVLKQETYQHLDPHLLHLLDYINTTTHPNNTLYQCHSSYFPNLIGVIEELFRNKKINPDQILSGSDKQLLKQAAKEALEADIDKRLLGFRKR